MHEPLPFGRYLLLTRIGVGGMAEVHLARQAGPAGFEKLLVIKRLLPELAWDPDMAEQFVEEARVGANLSHGNIVPVFDFGEVEGSYYLAMEYVEGKNLRALMVRLQKLGKSVPLPAALFMTAEVLRGLNYAHEKTGIDGEPLAIVHRDVSPQNVALSYGGDVKILDFGIAKSASREYRTQAGFVKGKLRYMSPEQAREDMLDGRSDVFSCGVMLHEMLCGRREVPDQNKQSLRTWLEEAKFDKPSEKNKFVGPDLDLVILRALAREPAERYENAGDFERAIRSYLARRYEEYGSGDIAALLRDSFASEIEAEQAWIKRALAAVPADGNSKTPGDLFVEKSVTRMELGDDADLDPTQNVDSNSLALGGSAESLGPVNRARKAQTGTEPLDKDPPSPPPEPTRRGRMVAAVVGLFLLLGVGGYVAVEGVPWATPTSTVVVQVTPSPVQRESPVESAAPIKSPVATPIARRSPVRPPTSQPKVSATAAPKVRGLLTVSVIGGQGWGEAFIRGKRGKLYKLGDTPIVRRSVPEGVYEVIVKQGNETKSKRVVIRRGAPATFVAQF